MITLEEKIARTERLLRRLEEDQPYLHVRLTPLPTGCAPKPKQNCSDC
jgi:hypothetical protein